jgi:hypothetical protein
MNLIELQQALRQLRLGAMFQRDRWFTAHPSWLE